MKSFIQEFQGEHEKQSDLVITVDGPSGAGKGTTAEQIAEIMSIEKHSAGNLFRKIAKEKNMTVEELSEKAGKQVDIEVDRRTLKKGLKKSCVIESRIASWVLGSYSDLRIYLTADPEERAKRIQDDLKNRETEQGGKTLKEIKQKIRERDRNNDNRYKDYYGINTSNLEIYNLVIDNTEMSVKEQRKYVKKALKKQFPDRFD